MIGTPENWFVVDYTLGKHTGPFSSERDALFAAHLVSLYGARVDALDSAAFHRWLGAKV